MSTPLLQVENLVKDFNGFRAVDRVSFTIPKGRIVGLLGPNGAGKTTTIHMLLGITTATAGRIIYFGREFAAHRQASLQRINFASSYNTLQGRISVLENFIVFGHLNGIRRPESKIRALSDYFGVTSMLHRRYWDLSTGQRTRVNLIKAL